MHLLQERLAPRREQRALSLAFALAPPVLRRGRAHAHDHVRRVVPPGLGRRPGRPRLLLRRARLAARARLLLAQAHALQEVFRGAGTPRGAPRGLACLLSLCGEGARSRFEDAFGGAFEGEAPATLMNRVAASRSVAGSKTRASKRAPGAVVPEVLRVFCQSLSERARAPARAAVRSRGGTPSRARSSAARSCASALAASAFDSRTAASRRDAARVDASSASASCLFFAASAFSRRRSVSSSFSRTPEGFRAATPRVSRAAGGSALAPARSCSRRACPRAATESLPPPSTLPFRRSPFGSTPPSVRFAAAYPARLARRQGRAARARQPPPCAARETRSRRRCPPSSRPSPAPRRRRRLAPPGAAPPAGRSTSRPARRHPAGTLPAPPSLFA